jgi:hypothetical protein
MCEVDECVSRHKSDDIGGCCCKNTVELVCSPYTKTMPLDERGNLYVNIQNIAQRKAPELKNNA